MQGSNFSDQLIGSSNTDGLSGLDGNDYLRGLGGDDHLLGHAGNDILDGGEGADVLEGGDGDDSYSVDDAADQTIEADAAGGFDTVAVTTDFSGQYYVLSDFIEDLVAFGSAPIRLSIQCMAAQATTPTIVTIGSILS